MSNEARINSSLQIRSSVGNLNYQSKPTAFTANVAGNNGPTPGAVLISTSGTSISFTQLTAMGGFCRIMNLDPTNRVEWGAYDPGTNTFYPVGEILAGETYVIRLSRHLQKDEVGTGTFSGTVTLRFKAYGASVRVLVEAFDP